MKQKIKKTNIFLALFLSLLTSLLGAGVFGLIYGYGYYIYILSAFQIYLTCVVFLNFIKKIRWWHVLIAIIWSTILSFAFSMLAILVCESIFIATEFNYSFADSAKLLFELCKTDTNVQKIMLDRIIDIVAMMIIGGIIISLVVIISNKRHKKISTQQVEKPKEQKQHTKKVKENKKHILDGVYSAIHTDMELIFNTFAENKDTNNFKVELKNIVLKYKLNNLPEPTKTELDRKSVV